LRGSREKERDRGNKRERYDKRSRSPKNRMDTRIDKDEDEDDWYHDRFDLLDRTPSPSDKGGRNCRNQKDNGKWPFGS